jgi:hypothetical protein
MFLRETQYNIRFCFLERRVNFNSQKKALIDHVFTSSDPVPLSFADLGGVWNVDGVYTFYTLRKYKSLKAFLVDTDFTPSVINMSTKDKSLKLIEGNFGEESIAEQMGSVDAIFLFDVLLHQVDPGWDHILEMYSGRTNYFLIYNQQWIGSDSSVRLLDMGKDEYFRNVPHRKDERLYKDLFEKMNEMHPVHKRIWRDIHNVWQWGLTDNDLILKMGKLGYKLQLYKNYGRFGTLVNFENHAFVFQKI